MLEVPQYYIVVNLTPTYLTNFSDASLQFNLTLLPLQIKALQIELFDEQVRMIMMKQIYVHAGEWGREENMGFKSGRA